ncbi:MAG: aminopeptidase [Thermoanaerobaculia bacterium]
MEEAKAGVGAEDLNRYARLLVELGAGLRPGQQLFIGGGVVHRDLASRVAAAARGLGAESIHLDLTDPLQEAQLIAAGRPRLIAWYHQRNRRWLDGVVATGGAVVTLAGVEFPDFVRELAKEHPRSFSAYLQGKLAVRAAFQEHVIQQRRCPWVMAPGLSPVWARQVFPGEDSIGATARLAEIVLRCTFADREDAVEAAAEHGRRLQARQSTLDALEIAELRVTGGGNDLRVGLSRRARWLGGVQQTLSGQRFYPNFPFEEVFTTPDARHTRGRLVASRPFRTGGGVLVRDLVLEFRDGRVVGFDASEGRDGFAESLEVDDGARRLGEIALVGEDSPIARTGLFFDLPLLDENAACHAALGDAYRAGLAGGLTMASRELDEIGCNRSHIHSDVLFGSPRVSVTATASRKGEVVLIEDGHWTERFAFGR